MPREGIGAARTFLEWKTQEEGTGGFPARCVRHRRSSISSALEGGVQMEVRPRDVLTALVAVDPEERSLAIHRPDLLDGGKGDQATGTEKRFRQVLLSLMLNLQDGAHLPDSRS